jgi:hypothetical protein
MKCNLYFLLHFLIGRESMPRLLARYENGISRPEGLLQLALEAAGS